MKVNFLVGRWLMLSRLRAGLRISWLRVSLVVVVYSFMKLLSVVLGALTGFLLVLLSDTTTDEQRKSVRLFYLTGVRDC